ncbi:MAG: prepilin-type N-terminal cleavage/methylation domain-containing protein [Phycisphaerae bacterium]
MNMLLNNFFNKDRKSHCLHSIAATAVARRRPENIFSGNRMKHGFTLIEVLAAMVLAAIVLPTALAGISMVTHLASETAKRQQAVILAEEKLAEILTGSSTTFAALQKFENVPAPGEYICRVETSESGLEGLSRIDVTVSWGNDLERQSLTLTTLSE